jgi:heterogeneous nuclear ribonucleoprotein A1/A3
MTVKKLFIGGLRENVTEDVLKSYFRQYGSILEVVIMKEKDTSKSRGVGFITFDDYDPIDKIIFMIFIFKKLL